MDTIQLREIMFIFLKELNPEDVDWNVVSWLLVNEEIMSFEIELLDITSERLSNTIAFLEREQLVVKDTTKRHVIFTLNYTAIRDAIMRHQTSVPRTMLELERMEQQGPLTHAALS